MEIEDYISLTDAELVGLTLEGDMTALEYLFDRYRRSILKIHLQRTGGNAHDADDLLQETLIKAYLNLHRYDSRYTFGQWIFAIGRNTFIDYVRRRRDDLSIDNIPKESSPISPVSAIPTPEESLIRSQQRVQFTACLEKMPEGYRQLIELRFLKEYSYEEIAAELNQPMGTIKTRIHRAREMMCRLITNETDR